MHSLGYTRSQIKYAYSNQHPASRKLQHSQQFAENEIKESILWD